MPDRQSVVETSSLRQQAGRTRLIIGDGFSLSAMSCVLTFLMGFPGAAISEERLAAEVPVQLAANDGLPTSREGLFGDDLPGAETTDPAKQSGTVAVGGGLKGSVQFELARTIVSPVHWTKMRTRAELGTTGTFGNGVKWKVGARVDVDGVYSYDDFYPAEVKRDQRFNFLLRENYIDYGLDNWEFRVGRQHVVWGEMVGLFFADVVSARDLKEFILPDFDALRIPQWAARAEYFKDSFHAELLWIPIASYDDIGKPNSEFFPVPPGASFRQELRPERNLRNTNYGLRLSTLANGWDASAFVYRSMDNSPTFYREIQAGPTFVFEARHDRIEQYGGTLAKDFESVVLKGEAVYTRGRKFAVQRLTDADGLVPQNSLDWAIGLDFSLPSETRFNIQFFQRAFSDHDPDMTQKKRESGYTLYLTSKLTDRLEAQAMWIASLDRTDWMFRPKLIWNFEKNWRIAAGADIFKGQALGLFGRFDNRDRVYSELRYSF